MVGLRKKSMLRKLLVTAVMLTCLAFGGSCFAAEEQINGDTQELTKEQAVRTILFYGCGSNLEDDEGGFLSENLRQILRAKISPDTHFIVMTGGSYSWQLEPEYLDGAKSIDINENQRHQIWECSGADENGNHGRMKLLGTIPEVVTKSMSDPAVLQAFIDYGVAHYPAGKYDLICWDHGGGPAGGYALDNLDGEERTYMKLGGDEQATDVKPEICRKDWRKQIAIIHFS